MYASLLRTSGALHLGIFDQPGENEFFTRLFHFNPDPIKDYYLHSNRAGYLMDNTSPTAAEPKYKDSPSGNRGTYKEIGTWSFTVQ
jgi:hypothetical protein